MELPIRMLLVVVVLTFTIATGYNALDTNSAVAEEAAARDAISEIAMKASMAGMGGLGMREAAEFEVKSGSRLTLRNENFDGSINGVVDVELSKGGRLLKVLPLPLVDAGSRPGANEDFKDMEKVFLSGSHRITLTHIGFSRPSNSNDTGFLLIG